jgi:hypothetical protein
LKPSLAADILTSLSAFIFFEGFKKLIAPTKKRITKREMNNSIKKF